MAIQYYMDLALLSVLVVGFNRRLFFEELSFAVWNGGLVIESSSRSGSVGKDKPIVARRAWSMFDVEGADVVV